MTIGRALLIAAATFAFLNTARYALVGGDWLPAVLNVASLAAALLILRADSEARR